MYVTYLTKIEIATDEHSAVWEGLVRDVGNKRASLIMVAKCFVSGRTSMTVVFSVNVSCLSSAFFLYRQKADKSVASAVHTKPVRRQMNWITSTEVILQLSLTPPTWDSKPLVVSCRHFSLMTPILLLDILAV